MRPDAGARVLCVDLDGTLVKTDTLHESMVALLATNPWTLPALLWQLLHGRIAFKAWLANATNLNAAQLPYRESVLAQIREARALGRTVILVTAAHEKIAHAVALYLGMFDQVMASDSSVNLKGVVKAVALRDRFGSMKFDYIGDSLADIAVWREAGEAVVVGTSPRVLRAITQAAIPIAMHLDAEPPSRIRTWLSTMRVHQWLKNLLIFAPLIASLSVLNSGRVVAAMMAFVMFGLVASAIYIINDVVDLSSDRRHPRKRERPIASGEIGVAQGIGVAGMLIGLAAIGSLTTLPGYFSASLLVYLTVTTAYSFFLKKLVIADVLTLAGLYTIRIIAGAFAIRVVPSFWLLAFSMFIFFGLALMKRFNELREQAESGEEVLQGRGYRAADLRLLESFGAGASIASVFVLALYINSQDIVRQYRSPFLLWSLCPLLLYWLGRLWLHTERGHMHDDPVVFAVKDPVSRLIAVFGAVVLASAALIPASLWPAP